jgi:hypothetical protein
VLSTSATSPDGGFRIWVDSHLLVDKRGLVVDHPSFIEFKLSANLSQGPGQPQTITWDNLRVLLHTREVAQAEARIERWTRSTRRSLR